MFQAPCFVEGDILRAIDISDDLVSFHFRSLVILYSIALCSAGTWDAVGERKSY